MAELNSTMRENKRAAFLLWAIVGAFVLGAGIVHFYHLPLFSSLKYIGLSVASISTLWGMMHELHTKDDAGKRHLLPEGRVSIAIIIGSLLCSLIGAVGDDVKKNNAEIINASNGKIKDALQRATEAAHKARENQLLRQIAEANEQIIKVKMQATQNGIHQHEDAQSTQKQQRKIADQNKFDLRLQAKRQKLVDEELAASTSNKIQSTAVRNDLADAKRSVQGLRQTLYGFDRTLNQIRDVRLTYMVRIPLENGNPEMIAYNAELQKAVSTYEASENKENSGVPFTQLGGHYTDINGHINSTLRFQVSRGSSLYPTDTSKFPGCMFSYPIDMMIWRKPKASSSYKHTLPDLSLETPQNAVPNLWYYPETHEMVLVYYNIPVLFDEMTRNIVSLPDLSGAKAEILPLFYDFDKQTWTNQVHDNLQLLRPVSRISMDISYHNFLFNVNNLSYSYDPEKGILCSFIFDFRKAKENDSGLPINSLGR